MCVLNEDNKLLKENNTIWDKVSADIKKNLIVSLSIIDFFWKTKIKSYRFEVKDFYD